MKNFALILSCEKYTFKRDKQDTSQLPMDFRYFVGNPKLTSPLEEGNVVYLPCRDEYEYLTKKTLLAFKWIRENLGFFDYILKTDDDVTFNKEAIQKMSKSLYENKTDYAGILHKGGYRSRHHFGKCSDERFNSVLMSVPDITYCIGGAYWVSTRGQEILGNVEDYSKYFSIYEDACIGNILVSNGLEATRVNIKEGMTWPET
jgi:hypothetical protein